MGAWRPLPHILQFFLKTPPPIKTDAPHGAPLPPLKDEPPHLKNNLPPLERESPFHNRIPRKSTVNNNLKPSWNPWKIYMKKFIFSKFAGLQTYSRQLYYQINSFTGIFRHHFTPPMLSICTDLRPPIKFWRAPPPWNSEWFAKNTRAKFLRSDQLFFFISICKFGSLKTLLQQLLAYPSFTLDSDLFCWYKQRKWFP